MPSHEQQRQKKLAKKRSKELAKKKELARHKNLMQSFAGQLAAAVAGPVDRCFVSEGLLESEMKFGSLVISRRMPDGRLGIVRFLVDGLCLGVKDVHTFFAYPAQMTEMMENGPEKMVSTSAAAVKKIVETAIAFAGQFEFEPHPDYRKVETIFTGVDANQCTSEFEFGRDGQPAFLSGPHDTPERVNEILDKLNRTAGEGNFVLDYDMAYDLDSEESDQWGDDPELDIDIDQDVPAPFRRG